MMNAINICILPFHHICFLNVFARDLNMPAWDWSSSAFWSIARLTPSLEGQFDGVLHDDLHRLDLR